MQRRLGGFPLCSKYIACLELSAIQAPCRHSRAIAIQIVLPKLEYLKCSHLSLFEALLLFIPFLLCIGRNIAANSKLMISIRPAASFRQQNLGNLLNTLPASGRELQFQKAWKHSAFCKLDFLACMPGNPQNSGTNF